MICGCCKGEGRIKYSVLIDDGSDRGLEVLVCGPQCAYDTLDAYQNWKNKEHYAKGVLLWRKIQNKE